MSKLIKQITLQITVITVIIFNLLPIQAVSDPYTNEEYPELESTYVYLADLDTGQVLYAQNEEERMYPASMTKIMTEILAIENLDLYQTVTITEQMWEGLIEADASTAGFYPGTTVTVLDLLYGSALPSGADAVNALAMFVSGSISSFVNLMNQKAQEIGMYNTHFTNVTGLHDSNHYSTAKDIATLYQYCLQNETFRQLINAHEYTASNGLTLKSTVWSRIDGEDGYTITGFEGGKSGYTIPAGRCLVSSAHFNGMHLVLVTGLAENAVADANTLYNYFAQTYQKTSIIYEGNKLSEIEVIDSNTTLTFTAPEDFIYDLPMNAEIVTSLELDHNEYYAPIQEGDHLGTYTISVNGIIMGQYEWIAETDVKRNTFKYVFLVIMEHPFQMIFIIIFLLLAHRWIRLIQIQRKRRRRQARKRRR